MQYDKPKVLHIILRTNPYNKDLPFFQVAFDFPIRYLNLFTCLGVIGGGHFMGVPCFFIKASKSLLQKCVPPSLMIARGVPNWDKMLSFRNFKTVFASLVRHGTASIHLET